MRIKEHVVFGLGNKNTEKIVHCPQVRNSKFQTKGGNDSLKKNPDGCNKNNVLNIKMQVC